MGRKRIVLKAHFTSLLALFFLHNSHCVFVSHMPILASKRLISHPILFQFLQFSILLWQWTLNACNKETMLHYSSTNQIYVWLHKHKTDRRIILCNINLVSSANSENFLKDSSQRRAESNWLEYLLAMPRWRVDTY